MMRSGLCASTQAELDRFFAALTGEPGRWREVSDRAFSQARRGFSARVFDRLNAQLLEQLSARIKAARWQGLRVVAADASRLSVSTRQGAELTHDHWAFALYLPGVELTLRASLHPADGRERQMLFEALDRLKPGRDLLVLDRGYPGNVHLAALAQRGLAFCVRVDATGWNCVSDFMRSGQSERIVALRTPRASECRTHEIVCQPTAVRLIRDITPSGRVRMLMTNLLDPDAFRQRSSARSITAAGASKKPEAPAHARSRLGSDLSGPAAGLRRQSAG